MAVIDVQGGSGHPETIGLMREGKEMKTQTLPPWLEQNNCSVKCHNI